MDVIITVTSEDKTHGIFHLSWVNIWISIVDILQMRKSFHNRLEFPVVLGPGELVLVRVLLNRFRVLVVVLHQIRVDRYCLYRDQILALGSSVLFLEGLECLVFWLFLDFLFCWLLFYLFLSLLQTITINHEFAYNNQRLFLY